MIEKEDIWYLAGLKDQKGILETDYKLIEEGRNGIELGPIKRINLFVGANNSGKSRLIRNILANGSYLQNLSQGETLYQLANRACNLAKKLEMPSGQKLEISNRGNLPQSYFPEIAKLIETIQKFRITNKTIVGTTFIDFSSIFSNIITLFSFSTLSVLETSVTESEKFTTQPSRNDALMEYMESLRLLIMLKKVDDSGNSAGAAFLRNRSLDSTFATINSDDLQELVDTLGLIRISFSTSLLNRDRHYIPILRSTHRLWTDNGNPHPNTFEKTVQKHYSADLSASTSPTIVHTGQRFYDRILAARNGSSEDRRRFVAFEEFMSKAFFEGKMINIIARINNSGNPKALAQSIEQQDISIEIEGSPEREIHHLGDGIQALIMLVFPIFMAEPKSLIFIEEPEINLHPGMQRIFLDVIARNTVIQKKELLFFMTTHSNHFLDLTLTENAPVSIFTLKRKTNSSLAKGEKEKFEIRHVDSGDLAILDELGVQNSSIFTANCSLWVEGPSDRRYIRKYLELYAQKSESAPLKSLSEDLHYGFFEYGGSLLNHYSFDGLSSGHEEINAHRLANRIFLLADLDRSAHKQQLHRSRQKLKRLGFQYKTTSPAIEIENLLSREVLAQVLPKVFNGWLENRHQEILKLDEQELLKAPLLPQLRKKLGVVGLKKSYLEGKTNTFHGSDKTKICDVALEALTWQNMTPTAKKLAKSIYAFIASHNGGDLSSHSLPKEI